MDLGIWLAFVAASAVFSLSPGAGAVASISHAINSGFPKACSHLLGLQLALFAHLVIVSLGLGALLASSAMAFALIKYLGAAYLLYLGVSRFLAKAVTRDESEQNTLQSSHFSAITQGFVVNMMNPKSIIFLAAFLPQFIDAGAPVSGQYLILGATVIVIDTLVMLGYSATASVARRHMMNPKVMAMQNKVFGTLFISMGLSLATVER